MESNPSWPRVRRKNFQVASTVVRRLVLGTRLGDAVVRMTLMKE